MKRPRDEYVPNQGCGIFFLMVLAVFFLLSIPVLKFTTDTLSYFFEKQILFSSDSPNETYHIEISTEGPSTSILIKEDSTSSALSADIVKDGKEDVHSKDIEIQWLTETVAEIIVAGRRDTFHYFRFDADAEEEKIKRNFPAQ